MAEEHPHCRRRARFLRAAGVLMIFLALARTGFAQFEGWCDNLAEARAQARASNRPLLVLFVLEGCPECERLERSLSDPRAERALEPFAKVVLEFNEHRDLALRYGIEYTPTLLIYLPTDNFSSAYTRQVGALSPSAIERLARRALSACQVQAASPGRETSATQTASSRKQAPPRPAPVQRTSTWMAAQRSLDAPVARGGEGDAVSFSQIYHEATQPPPESPSARSRRTRH